MKHIIDVIEFPKNIQEVNKFTINNPRNIIADFNNVGIFPRILLPRSEFLRYVNEDKIYYTHTYGDTYNVSEDIYATVFVYNNVTNTYHIGIIQDSIAKRVKNSVVELLDLTTRISSSKDFWISKYCIYNVEKFHVYQTDLMCMCDTPTEATEDMLEDVLKRLTYKLGIEKAIVMTLNNKELYQAEIDKIINERINELKISVERELSTKKEHAQTQVEKLSAKITNINENLNKIKAEASQ